MTYLLDTATEAAMSACGHMSKWGPILQQAGQSDTRTRARPGRTHSELEALRAVERITRDAIVVGAVPNFDTEVLGERMRWHGICPSWHYHLVDVETLAAGGAATPTEVTSTRCSTRTGSRTTRRTGTPPWVTPAWCGTCTTP
ncbi:hypothetical protein [Actinokineospora sp.]|uniref:hypothetical protein n=1 Tax=Actinokineospora sp. TaxID=1872133 RepID=UPI003D6A8C3B